MQLEKKKSKMMRNGFELQIWRLISFRQNGNVLHMLLELEEILLTADKMFIAYNFIIFGCQFNYVMAFVMTT